MSRNGQVVIPAAVRSRTKAGPQTKYLVLSRGPNILLKRLDEDSLRKEYALLDALAESEGEIRRGKGARLDLRKSDEELIDELSS